MSMFNNPALIAEIERRKTQAGSLPSSMHSLPSNTQGGLVHSMRQTGIHSYTREEARAFAEHLNKVLGSDPMVSHLLPINPSNDDLFKKVSQDGLLLCAYINAIRPGTIPPEDISKPPRNRFEKLQNHSIAIQCGKALGLNVVNVSGTDLERGTPHLVLGFVWQLVRTYLLEQVSVAKHPELVLLAGKDEDKDKFANLPPEETLLRWVNWHLGRSGCARRISNFSEDLQDSMVYSHLLRSIAPAELAGAMPRPEDVEALGSHVDRARLVLDRQAAPLGCVEFVTAEDIASGNHKLNLAFVASLFHAHPGLQHGTRMLEGDAARNRALQAAMMERLRAREADIARQMEEEQRQRRAEWERERAERDRAWQAEVDERRRALEEEEARRHLEMDKAELAARREMGRLREEQERAQRLAEEQRVQRLAEEQRAQRLAEEQRARLEEEERARRLEEEQRARRLEEEQRARRIEEEQRARRIEEEARAMQSVKMTFQTYPAAGQELPVGQRIEFAPPPVPQQASTTGAPLPGQLQFFHHVQQRAARHYVVAIDKSGSMAVGSRWKEAEQTIALLAPIIVQADPSGVDLWFFGSPSPSHQRFTSIRSPYEVQNIFASVRPSGTTDMSGVLMQMFQTYSSHHLPITILVITDGVPNKKETVAQVLHTAANRTHPGQLAVSFIQIGMDTSASQWLNGLVACTGGGTRPIADKVTIHDMQGLGFYAYVNQHLGGGQPYYPPLEYGGMPLQPGNPAPYDPYQQQHQQYSHGQPPYYPY